MSLRCPVAPCPFTDPFVGELGVEDQARLVARAKALRAALDRLDEGRYGVCLACERPISAGRLQVLPEAERCLGCEERRERRQRRPRPWRLSIVMEEE